VERRVEENIAEKGGGKGRESEIKKWLGEGRGRKE